MGHDVRVAADGVEAVALAKAFEPQIALLDIGMPRMDGYEAARRIREALGDGVVLVALTGWGQDEDQRRAYAAGFDHHLTKPAEPAVLEALIASVANSGSGEAVIRAQGSGLKSTNAAGLQSRQAAASRGSDCPVISRSAWNTHPRVCSSSAPSPAKSISRGTAL